MRKVHSLDDLISKKAIEFADQIKSAAAMAEKEEEIRIEVEKQLAFIQREAGIKLEGKHEFTVASGRVDSVYDRVIIEYKNPKSPGAHIGPRADSPGSKKVIKQIKDRFYDMRSQYHQPLNTLFGVGLDGNCFIFVRFRDNKWQIQEPVEVSRYSAERFLWALFNLGTKGKAFSPEYLAGDFGSEGSESIATTGIHSLYDAIVMTDNPKAQIFFSQWKILFGEVCGYDVDHPSDKIKKLADFYGLTVHDLKPAELLFAVHNKKWERANYTELGFLDKRKNRANKLWPIFLGLASKNLPSNINRPIMKPKDIDRIRDTLRKFFGIKKLPIKYNRRAREYCCNFKFNDPRDWTSTMQNENLAD